MMPLTQSTEEIEHWCPVCDRLIIPTCTLVSGPPSSISNENTAPSSIAPTTPTSPVIPSERPTTPTTPVHKRKAALRAGGGGTGGNASRPTLYRSRTSMHTIASGHKKRLGATTTGGGGASDHSNRSNPNFVQEFALSTQGHGGGGAATTAPRTKTSPMGNTSHSDNAKITDGQPGPAPGTNEKTESRSRDGGPSAGLIKRKASAPDVNAGPRLKPLTKAKTGAKSRPKSLNLTTAQLFETSSKSTKNLDHSGVTTPSEPPTAVDPQTPTSTSTGPQDTVEELRRRLYCSEECYNIDLKGINAHRPPTSLHDSPTTTPTSPALSVNKLFEVKNMSCEMPWLWTNAALPRRMIPTRNPSWVDSGEEESEYGGGNSRRRSFASEQEPTWLTITQKRSTAPHRKPVPERRQSMPVESQEANALRKEVVAAPSLAGARRATFMAPIESPEDSNSSSNEFYRTAGVTGVPTSRGEEHRLFFRRMPGKLDAVPVTKPALFVVDGQWTETPPPGFDYAGFMAAREKERRRRQVEITEAMLLKKKVEDVGPADEVARRHHESSRRKKHVHAERIQYERRHSSVHDGGHYDAPLSSKQHQPWWHVDEREDWKTYWAAREEGLENTTFEQWQLQRHAERVKRAEKEQALKRFESEKLRVQKEIASRTTGDGKKVAKRPFLIRVASQPTVSDVDLVGKLYEQTQKSVQQAQERKAALARNNSSSSETSPLGMNRPRPLPPFKSSFESIGEIKRTASPSSFMRGQTLCIPGFVVTEGQSETAPNVVSPASPPPSGFVFPLVTVPGSVETRLMEVARPVQAAPETMHILPEVEHRGRPSSIAGSKAASSASESSSKQAEPQAGSHQRTLVPFVSQAKVAASLSPVRRLNSEQALKLALQRLPTEVVSGSPEIVTAVSGTGSGSGSSGEESSWSSGEKPSDRPATVKATSTMKRPRTARGSAQTQVRPKSMGPLGCPANLRMSKADEASPKPDVSSPQSYTASLLRYYSEFRGGSTLPGNKPNTSPITDGIEPESRLGKRRSLWGIFGSAKP